MQKVKERALRVKDSISDYETLLSISEWDSFRISSINIMAVEICKILNDMGRDIYRIYFLNTLFIII